LRVGWQRCDDPAKAQEHAKHRESSEADRPATPENLTKRFKSLPASPLRE
jgi:hypothetical protein